MKPEYALSIRQPWAWLICKGYKDIENRNWKCPSKYIGQRVYIHAGKKFDKYVLEYPIPVPEIDRTMREMPLGTFVQSAIIGEATITDCVTESDSQWFEGKYGFVMADPVLYGKPIPYKGRLGFFKPEINEDILKWAIDY